VSLLGLRADTTAADVRAALLEAHAFAVRGNVEDLERCLGRSAAAVVVCGGAAADGRLPALLTEVLGRDVHHAEGASGAAAAGAVLVGKAVGAHAHRPGLPASVLPAGDAAPWEESYQQWRAASAALRAALPEP
jgi:sugar (pentulose or hexulose) kinase